MDLLLLYDLLVIRNRYSYYTNTVKRTQKYQKQLAGNPDSKITKSVRVQSVLFCLSVLKQFKYDKFRGIITAKILYIERYEVEKEGFAMYISPLSLLKPISFVDITKEEMCFSS